MFRQKKFHYSLKSFMFCICFMYKVCAILNTDIYATFCFLQINNNLGYIQKGMVYLQITRPVLFQHFYCYVQGHELQKTVFVVFFHGEQIKLRVKKVCNGFQATLYPCPATFKEQQEMLAGVESRIKDLEIVSYDIKLLNTNVNNIIFLYETITQAEKILTYRFKPITEVQISKLLLILETS